jgi:anhydro-N-acetylmuramic acid kinase
LIDEAVRRLDRGSFDRGGRIAAAGSVDLTLLAKWLQHPYFRRRPPKSTGRELFPWEWVKAKPSVDLVATLTLLTARTIADAVRRYAPANLQEVIVSGGGVYNRTLMKQLEWLLWPVIPRPSTVYGLHPMAKEAAAFALLAVETVRGRPGNLPTATGADRAVVLGKIIPGKNFSRLMKKELR